MGELSDEIIYPNSPLIDVACEIRFPGEMQIECERHLFWEKIRADYPDILVPGAQPGQAPALQHYRFRSADTTRAVLVALNSFSYSETSYRGHLLFIKEHQRLLKLFSETFTKIDKVNRLGWRYVNIIPFTRESGRIPLERFMKFELPLPQQMGSASSNIDLRTELQVKDGLVIFALQNANKSDQPSTEALRVDIDYSRTGPNLRLRDIAPEIENVRRSARTFFEDLITDEYRDYLRGNKL